MRNDAESTYYKKVTYSLAIDTDYGKHSLLSDYSKEGPQTNSIGISWELVEKTESETPPRPT